MPTAKSRTQAQTFRVSTRSKDLPASRGMLQLVRTELKADLGGLRAEMNVGFSRLEGRIVGVEDKMSGLDSQISRMEANFSRLETKISDQVSRLETRVSAEVSRVEAKVSAEISRLGILLEEQNANNRIVLEGLTGLWQRQERIEAQLPQSIEAAVATFIARAKS